jgi:lipopolysaccharide transport system permease protein
MGQTWWSELWRYRELLYFLAARDIKVRYKQASLGAAWAVIQPVATMLVFTVFFGRISRIPSDGLPYPLFSFCGLIAWLYFSSTVSQASNSLLANSHMITKVYFPRVYLPAASALGCLLDFAIAGGVLVVMMIYYGVRPGPLIFITPILIVTLIFLALGVSLILAAVNVRFRDVRHAVPFGLQLWMFATPIIYPLSYLPKEAQKLSMLNPLTGIVENLRAAVLGGSGFNWRALGASLAISMGVFWIGSIFFRREEKRFADVV